MCVDGDLPEECTLAARTWWLQSARPCARHGLMFRTLNLDDGRAARLVWFLFRSQSLSNAWIGSLGEYDGVLRINRVDVRRLSEQRLTELLDSLCENMSKKHCYAAKEDSSQRQWVAVDAQGYVPADRAEKERQQQELENYCSRILDEYEEEIAVALRSTNPPTPRDLLCKRLTGECIREQMEL